MRYRVTSLLLVSFFCITLYAENDTLNWRKIDEGLHITAYYPSLFRKRKEPITIIRIDPNEYRFRTYSSDQYRHGTITVQEWVKQYNLIGAINAGMYLPDYKTNVGFMQHYNYRNNPKNNPKYKSYAAFNPKVSGIRPFEIYDGEDCNLAEIKKKYYTIIQNLRLIKKPGENRWERQRRRWSEAALGIDTKGNVLLIYTAQPYTMYDFNEILLKLPLGLQAAQHLEGGPDASLYLNHKGVEFAGHGEYDFGYVEPDNPRTFWPIPNIIGFVKRK